MRAAGFSHSLAKTRLLAKLLDNAHAVDHFVEAIIDICEVSAHATNNRRAVALVNYHHNQHRRENSDRHQRHTPVQAEHRHQHRANQRGTAQNRCDNGYIEVADHLGVIGDARNNLPDRLSIKLAQRLAQRGIHHIRAKLLDHAHGGPVKQQRLRIVQPRRRQL